MAKSRNLFAAKGAGTPSWGGWSCSGLLRETTGARTPGRLCGWQRVAHIFYGRRQGFLWRSSLGDLAAKKCHAAFFLEAVSYLDVRGK